jgi:hypothetical protein
LGIPRVFSRLDFEAAIAYSLCAGFVTCICLFIERDVSCVILQLGAPFAGTRSYPLMRPIQRISTSGSWHGCCCP